MVAAAVATAGCAGAVKNMREVSSVNVATAPNEAVIVFMRPSGMAFGIQSSVWEIADNQPSRLVGIVAAKKKVAISGPRPVRTSSRSWVRAPISWRPK